ncbi:P-loop NTPase fold protein [Vibrio splendidus]|uniref:KAP family P-loop NTPase fold protein n=1 Tax=Vibrio TaxID=662 RepID=UPI0013000E04|nr:P-loop NTPase fold protein [Vibrio splendidus]
MKRSYEDWKDKYNFDNCGLNNKEYGEYLSSYLRSQKKPLVMNLNGEWGTGKTHFLRQMYSNLRFTHGYPVIFLNSWRSDFSNDPLLVLISEFIEQFQSISANADAHATEEKILKVAAKFSKRLWNMTAVGVGTYLSGQTDNSAMVEMAKTLTFEDKEAVSIGRNLTENYKSQLCAIEDTRLALVEYLSFFPEGKQKVFVLIDELDRCRPTYAIEMLETIKHFFSLDNYVFVVATDTKQLSHSIKAVYGSSFDGNEYLSRFFNRSAALPLPDKILFAKLLVKNSILEERKEEMRLLGGLEYSKELGSRLLAEVSIMYNLSLRRMEQVFNKFESCVLYELDSGKRFFDIRLLMQLIAEYDSTIYRDVYSSRKLYSGMRYHLSKEFKEGIGRNFNTDDITTITNSINKEELARINPKHTSYLSTIKEEYLFSWEFANGFSNNPISEAMTVHSALMILQKEIDGSRHNSAIREQRSSHRNNLLTDYKKWLFQVNMYDREVLKVWTRADYFKAVELSAYIEKPISINVFDGTPR